MNGSNIFLTDDKNRTALRLAAENGQYAAVRLLLERDAKTDNIGMLISVTTDKLLSIPGAPEAVRSEYRNIIRLLNDYKSAYEKPAFPRSRELLNAIKKGDTAEVNRMISEDKNLIGEKWDNETPLLAAVSGNRKDIAELLTDCGADVNAKGGRYDRTPLIAAASRGNTEIVGLLLKNCADVEARDSRGHTALMEAVYGDHTECIGLLLDSGADIYAKRASFPTTALEFAVRLGHADSLGYLLERGAKPGNTDELVRLAKVYLGNLPPRAAEVRKDRYRNVIKILDDYQSYITQKK